MAEPRFDLAPGIPCRGLLHVPEHVTGGLGLSGLAAIGVSALLTTSAAAFTVLKWVGAAYLAYLGIRMLLSKPGGAAHTCRMDNGQYLRQTMMITLLNPKAIVFYMAFFPLFVDPATHQGLTTFAAMAATIAALTFAYGLGMTLLVHLLAERLRANPLVTRTLEKIAGLFLIGFGVKLALSR